MQLQFVATAKVLAQVEGSPSRISVPVSSIRVPITGTTIHRSSVAFGTLAVRLPGG
jgi:hypothetical protein